MSDRFHQGTLAVYVALHGGCTNLADHAAAIPRMAPETHRVTDLVCDQDGSLERAGVSSIRRAVSNEPFLKIGYYQGQVVLGATTGEAADILHNLFR
jgi:hypothetical protein